MEYEVKIAGVSYPFTSLTYSRDYWFEAEPFEIRLPTLETFSGGEIVEIFRDGVLVYRGRIAKSKKTADETGTETVITGYDLKRKLHFIRAVNRIENREPAYQIIDNLANSDLTQGTVDLYGVAIAMEYGSKDEAKFMRDRLFEEICFVTGWEIYVNPSGALDFKSQCGVDRSATVRFRRGELLLGYVEPYTVDASHKVKRIVVLGNKQGDYMNYGIAQAADYVFGDREKEITRKNLVNDDTCQRAAASLFADYANDVKKVVIRVLDDSVGLGFDVFDRVNLKDELLGIDENLRIYHIRRRFESVSGEETELSLTNLTKLCTNGQFLLRAGESYIESSARSAEDYGKTKDYSPKVESSTSFPTTDLYKGRQFYRSDQNILYYYDGTTWKPIIQTTGEGTTFPTSPQLGDIFYRTDEMKFYRWNGTSWVYVATKDHGTLVGLTDDDHTQYHTSARHAATMHLASMLRKGLQPWNSDITFTATANNAFSWTAGTIYFADGGTQSITSGSASALAAGVYYVFFTLGVSTLTVSSSYSAAVGDDKGLLAVVGVTADTAQRAYIQPFYSRGLNINADVIAANAILTGHIKALQVTSDKITTDQIVAKDFRTALNVGAAGGPAGIRFTSSEIAGYSGGTTKEFFLSATDGKAMAGGGNVILDRGGITIRDEYLKFIDDINYLCGHIKGVSNKIRVTSVRDLELFASDGYNVKLGGGLSHVVPTVSLSQNLGTSTLQWLTLYCRDFYISTHLVMRLLTASGTTRNTGCVQFFPMYVDWSLLPATADYGYIGESDRWWWYVYARYLRYKTNVAAFEALDDLSLIKKAKVIKHIDPKTKEEKDIYDPDDLQFLRIEGEDFYDVGNTTGFLFGCVRQLLSRVEELEEKVKKLSR